MTQAVSLYDCTIEICMIRRIRKNWKQSLTKNTYTPLQYNDACIYFTEIRNWYIQGDKTQKKGIIKKKKKTQKKGTTLQMYSQRYCVEDKYY